MRRNSRILGVVLIVSLAAIGCDDPTTKAKPDRLVPIVLSTGSRFQSVEGGGYGIALDTKIGELCHTFNEEVDTPVPSSGSFHITGVAGHPSLDSIPLCIDLSQNETATVKQILDANQKARASDAEQKGIEDDLKRMENQVQSPIK